MPFIQDPLKDGSFGSTKDWKSTVDDNLNGLDATSLEKWLWREDFKGSWIW